MTKRSFTGGTPPRHVGGRTFRILFTGLLLLLGSAFLASLAIGRYDLSVTEVGRILLSRLFDIEPTWTGVQESVVMNLRIPRSIAAVVIGSALALAGASYQSIFKNPMVSPDLLGVSAGATVGAAIAILGDYNSAGIQIAAFLGGLVTVGLTMSIPRLIRNDSTMVLVLSGIVMGAFMSSIMSILKFVADTDVKLAEITYWTMGSFAQITLDRMWPVLPAIVVPMALILLMRYRLNVLSLGDNEAKSLGVNLKATRGMFILASTLLTASAVCLAGTVGWVGLVIPHVARMIVGPDNKVMLPGSMVLGGTFMLFIDILSRTLSAAELRLGILTGIIGAPFFIFILYRQRRQVR